MQTYEYKVVPAPRRPKRTRGSKTVPDRFAKTLTDVINAEAADGWEYLRAESLPVEEKKGMLTAATEAYHAVLVFRRDLQPADRTVIRPATPRLRVAEPAETEVRTPAPSVPYRLGPADQEK
ncbi:MAG: DUF4177 domain-containing protein [Pseudomonadota bacterium]